MMRVLMRMRDMLREERGSALLLSYLITVVLLGIGASFIVVSINESRTAERQRMSVVAFHVAEAGVERALYDLRQDFINGGSTPSWSDGNINGMAIGPDSSSFYSVPYGGTTINGGSYAVEFQNDAIGNDMWVRSTGTYGDVTESVTVYVRMVNLSPWDNAIFAGSGAAGAMINGNVDIRGSVHVLGTGLNPGDYAMDLGGTSQLVGNNYNGVDSGLVAKVPALTTVVHNGETVETLEAELRVKNGLVGLSGSATVGEANIYGNSTKETVKGSYVTDGFGGNQGAAAVHSDNGTTNAYDLGDAVAFPSLSDPSKSNPAITHQQYLHSIAYVPTAAEAAQLASITPSSSFTIGNASGSITMDGAGNMTVNGIVYIDNGGQFNTSKQGSNKTITYSGTGTVLATGNVQINTSMVTNGNNSFPTNILGIMTPGSIGFNEANIDTMGLFYAETQVTVQKQTDIMGTIVSNYFDMGTNVPSIFQVPQTVNHLPPGMVGSSVYWYMVVAWLN